jgi:hypothetical protein
MNDCIERKKAIELIQPHVKPQTVYGKGYLQAIEHATDILELMPAADVQPVRRGRWITKVEDYYKAWQDSGRSWDDMPYFVTGLKFACSNCFEQFDVNAEGVEKWNGCPLCLARMDGEQNENN